ncbi:DNA mismatch repair endonuclease MutL [Clostridium sp. WLY-B-L2]|uniref:DNA mismatch repair protein MutL n=1 Tax=Clostridium aromativorans TaxID=2836848 RepID=A0ABS8N6U7_9CLOT|nr:DNA mismatch repair endonuclease MutL [Clostridium aromativorans]MCC9295513.1 DNA mismatch repair endonuclease MutL [Clostridium aromativorans]
MKRINLLDINTSNKIAAGEVVEGPSSVVKELLENSIDSGAKNITVEIEEGGEKSIKVLDDGCGIHPMDIEKAFMPHATSKISSVEDLEKVNTMGFRGEALASIAAVSNVILKSRTAQFDSGMEIKINGGKLEGVQHSGCNPGTSVLVKNLFFNVPARQKFLKSPGREAAGISDIISRLSLANADISFKFFKNGKKSITTYGSGNVMDVVRCIYGKNIYENVIPIEKHGDIISIYGYIGNSEISRGSRNNQSLFVNKRYVKNKSIATAVEKAFKSFITINKFPFFILFIDIFPEFIDVNVHPAKWEVKFSDSGMVFKFVFDAVHEALRDSLKDSFTIEPDIESTHVREIQIPVDLESLNSKNYLNSDSEKKEYNNFINENAGRFREHESNLYKSHYPNLQIDSADEVNGKTKHRENAIAKFPPLEIIGQFHNTYIIAEDGNNLYMVDQHAAHEKILFEKYKKSIQKGDILSQVLATPVVMELTPIDYNYYMENENVFKKTGFKVELFGDTAVSIREVPMILGKPDIKNLFMDMIDNLKNMGSGEPWEVKYLSIATLACKAAIKAKDHLSHMEMKSLLEELRFIEDPYTCPHGRPVIIKFTLNDLEKKFKRIQ